MKIKYLVIKETPGYHIDSYSDTETMGAFDDVYEALQERDKLDKTDPDWTRNFYVQVEEVL